MKALIIDDSQFIRRIIKGVLLGSCKIRSVSERENGREGLEELLKNPTKYDIVFLDWSMPEMDGIDVLLTLRAKKVMTPVVMCTNAGQKENIINAISAGANEYLIKPFEPSALEDKVHQVLTVTEEKVKRESHKRVLIVDDSAIIRKIIHSYINDEFIDHIVHAKDGFEAIQHYREKKFDLIILDWEMPRMKGIDVLKAIRRQDTSIPILMATSQSDSDHIIEAFDAGVSNFISKPFNKDELNRKVEQLLLSPKTQVQ